MQDFGSIGCAPYRLHELAILHIVTPRRVTKEMLYTEWKRLTSEERAYFQMKRFTWPWTKAGRKRLFSNLLALYSDERANQMMPRSLRSFRTRRRARRMSSQEVQLHLQILALPR